MENRLYDSPFVNTKQVSTYPFIVEVAYTHNCIYTKGMIEHDFDFYLDFLGGAPVKKMSGPWP